MKWLRMVVKLTRMVMPDHPERCANCGQRRRTWFEIVFLSAPNDDKVGILKLCAGCLKGRLSVRAAVEGDQVHQQELYVNVQQREA